MDELEIMPLGIVAITERYPVIAYIGLGANLGDPPRQLEAALKLLEQAEEVEVLKVSRFYLNPPMGPPGQPWYVNAVAQVKTRLSPEELFRVLLGIEVGLGRIREGQRWGPRFIDLDLLLYDGVVMEEARLTLPHPEMHRRAFVLVPLAEIAPEAWHPVLNKTARQLMEALDPKILQALCPVKAREETQSMENRKPKAANSL